MKILIGDSGLIGGVLKEKIKFDFFFNSKNISDFDNFKFNNSELYLSCLPATKWMVNKNPNVDFENLYKIVKIISKNKYKKIILISTIDVYNDSKLSSDEDSKILIEKLSYGTNRFMFEILVENFVEYEKLYIFRLPALFGKGIKKNILFDLLNNNNIEMINYYSTFQWYNLKNLADDIFNYTEKYPNEKRFNLFTEPIETSNILEYFPKYKNKFIKDKTKIEYNFKTKFSKNGYINSKENVLKEIKLFIDEFSGK